MYISKFRVRNYKSYFDSGEVTLGPGINIITGQNHSGKTAVLQVLKLNFTNTPHRSSKTLPTAFSQINSISEIEIEINITKEEIEKHIFGLSQLEIKSREGSNPAIFDGNRILTLYCKKNNTMSFTFNAGLAKSSYDFLGPQMNDQDNWSYSVDRAERVLTNVNRYHGHSLDSSQYIGQQLASNIYFFKAERLGISNSPYGNNRILSSDASNLPEVLSILQGEKNRNARFINRVKQIFPQIFDISTRPCPQNVKNVEIVVWNEDPILERADLAVPLSESGTGIGQVLAILYVVLTYDFPAIIIIDEPNSFLHPGAARKLIEILKEHTQHQFIISTHSPSTIAAANPRTLNIVRNKDAQSTIEEVDLQETKNQELFLAEIGSKLSDVFGADNILWVEGKTEEICFPKIVEAINHVSLMGTTILGIVNTGDLQSKNSTLIYNIYNKLTSGKGLMPPAIGFIFDSEDKSEKEMTDIKRQSKDKVVFTKRVMYENYLLNPKAIFNVLKSIDEIKELKIEEDNILVWIEDNKWNKKYIKLEYAKKELQDEWLTNVHGAKFLTDLFSYFTQSLVSYDKIVHSVALTEWIIENSIDDLNEIKEILTKFLSKK